MKTPRMTLRVERRLRSWSAPLLRCFRNDVWLLVEACDWLAFPTRRVAEKLAGGDWSGATGLAAASPMGGRGGDHQPRHERNHRNSPPTHGDAPAGRENLAPPSGRIRLRHRTGGWCLSGEQANFFQPLLRAASNLQRLEFSLPPLPRIIHRKNAGAARDVSRAANNHPLHRLAGLWIVRERRIAHPLDELESTGLLTFFLRDGFVNVRGHVLSVAHDRFRTKGPFEGSSKYLGRHNPVRTGVKT